MDASISVDRISEAADLIDPIFLNTPQFECEPLSDRLGVRTVLKVESVNPIRSFKGRGTDYLLHRLGPQPAGLVCASAGNFGQGMAYAARKRSVRLTVFAAVTANPLKVDRMGALGAEVILEGTDFDEAKEGAIRHAAVTGAFYVEDGLLGPIAEGAGTIALELGRLGGEKVDVCLVPLGNGSLVNGMGSWLKRFSPTTRVIAVCPAGAPAMRISWRANKPVSTATMDTIADGIAVRVPVAEALEIMRGSVDDVMAVTDEEIVEAMRLLHRYAGLVVEPAGAAGIAAVANLRHELAGKRVAVPLTGGNLTDEQIRLWLY
ncbi:MAG TPA: pyridoxal-phosphate dependent enzyme [Candidatus Dormibacteraeota bacterium]|nr:pyridoxal-phosphate dependent enzyme [Candidatus Dormibacteraeota bacterium]